MSDLPSIHDLIPSSGKKATQKPLGGTIEEKFNKKMGKIADLELEIDTMRKANSVGFPHIDLEKFPISQIALKQVPREEVERLQAACFFLVGSEARVGAVDPSHPEVQALVKEIAEKNNDAHVQIYIISVNSLNRILKLYDTLPIVKALTKDIDIKAEDLEKVQADINDFRALQELIQKKSTTDLVTIILGAGLKLDSSDIHIEAEQEKIVVRFRLDGILHDAATIPMTSFRQIISRIKLVSSLKINITDKPQDGRFTIKLPSHDVDVRVSTLPTVYGESVVMRLLNQSKQGISLADLGLRNRVYDTLIRELQRPNGMIITTGPTGSGKTTTLYSAMMLLNKPGVKIITLEDPVEYKMNGINQSQIDRSKEYTFAKGLKSILRQDPDICMVGEIRDLETADISIQAALTGHLMMSTIHTNSAAGAIPRFLSMGVKPFLLAPALNAIIGQRLVRKLCEACKKPTTLSAQQKERVEKVIATMPEVEKAEAEKSGQVFYTAPGCANCNQLGFKGRVGLYEILEVNKAIEASILSGQVSEYDIESNAIQNGMATMAQDGVLKALDGITSLDEVFRVIE